MPCGKPGKCEYAYRKPGTNAMNCRLQTGNGGKWDFCAHQYFCRRSDRYELSADANGCALPQREAEKSIDAAQKALAEAETVFAEELQPKIADTKPKSRAKKKTAPVSEEKSGG